MQIEQILNAIQTLSQASIRSLIGLIKEVSYPKGHILSQAGRVETSLYFIKKGIVRAYAPMENNEVTFWLGAEGGTILSMRSYVQHQPAYENIELLEDCVLYQLKTEDLQRLFNEDIEIANWGRKLAEQELLILEERHISRQFKTALERYKELLKSDAQLLRRVQLGHIASYLGITQVSLSRIRAEI